MTLELCCDVGASQPGDADGGKPGAARSRLTTITPSTYLERLVELLTDSMDDMVRTSVVQLPITLAIAAGGSPRCQTLHPVR